MVVESWVLIGLTGAIIVAFFNIYQKYIIDDDTSPLKIALQMHIVATILMLFVLSVVPYDEDIGNFASYEIISNIGIYIPGIPSTGLSLLLLATGLVNALSFLLLASAYSHDALTIIAPLRGITPIIVALIEPIFFQSLSYQIELILASIIVATGIYVILYEDNIYKPIKRIKDIGVIKGISSAAVIALAVIIDRYALVNYQVDPINYTGGLIISTLIFTALIVILLEGKNSISIFYVQSELIPLGILRTLSVLFAIVALSLVEGTRVNVLWQTNVIIAAVLGGSLLKEENLLIRTGGALLIIIAASIIVLI